MSKMALYMIGVAMVTYLILIQFTNNYFPVSEGYIVVK